MTLDALHFIRSGGTLEELAAADPAAFACFHISDASAAPPHDLAHEARFGRLLPGVGGLPLAEMLEILPRDLPVGIEVPRRGLPRDPVRLSGPVVKIDPGELPRGPNLHWLGPTDYDDLPAYLSGWDAGWMPFALNAATRFISPTKTPECLAAGLPLVSTAVADVVRGYGRAGWSRSPTRGMSLRSSGEPRAPGSGLGGAGEGAPRVDLLGSHLVGDGRAHPPAA